MLDADLQRPAELLVDMMFHDDRGFERGLWPGAASVKGRRMSKRPRRNTVLRVS